MLNAFEYFGGVPEKVLTDNMKTVTIGREAGKPIWNKGMLEIANDMGFVMKVCKIRRPQTKGKVERLVGYVKDNFMAGRTFSDISDLNSQARDWCEKVNGKISAAINEPPLKRLPLEKLKPLASSRLSVRKAPPICGKEYSEPPAVSRIDNKTLICSRCGLKQALEAAVAGGHRISQEEQNELLEINDKSMKKWYE